MGFDAGGRTPPVVVYDANLLYPFHTRNLFVQLGVDHFVAPRWTDEIHEEWIANLSHDGKATRQRLIRTRDIMNRALPAANVVGYQHRIARLSLPDMNDRHVLAAAIEAKATIILTFNLRDFPAKELDPFGVSAIDPDIFLTDLFIADPEGMGDVVEAARANLSQTVPSRVAFLDILERQRLPRFVSALR